MVRISASDGWLAMSSFDKMLGWFPNTRREWIEVIITAVLLALLMMTAIAELELVLMPDQWRLNLASNAFASSCDSRRPDHLLRHLPFCREFVALRKVALIRVSDSSVHPSLNEGCGRFDDDRNLVVVAIAEPIERHRVRAFSSKA